tara:strand:- start:530 stop:1867 length:1338 start_codon:yes stop_codon:yes gene_type:complete
MTSRYIEIRPDNIPANGKISFKNGFPVLSFTISAQDGMLDPSTIRIVGNFNAFKDNLVDPTRLVDGDDVTMNNRLGIYNVIESLTIRANRTKMVCENIRHYSKFMNSYLAMTSSLQDQLGHLQQSCLIYPNATTFRKAVMENASSAVSQTNEFSFHIPCGFIQSGQMVDLRPDAFGGIQLEFLLQPDSNVLFNTNASTTGIGDAHYELSNLKLTCEVSDIPAGTPSGAEGAYDFNTITSLYTSINSTNAQIQYSLALRNVISAFVTFMPVSNINTLTQDGQATTFPSGDGASLTALAPIRRVQYLKGGTKYPAEFDYVTNIVNATNTATKVVDPQVVKTLVEAISPDSQYSMERLAVSPANMNRNYNMTTGATSEDSYMNIAEGGGVYGLAVKYGIGESGDDFSQEQWGLSVESDLKSDNPIGVYIFIKSKSQLLYSPQGVQLRQ